MDTVRIPSWGQRDCPHSSCLQAWSQPAISSDRGCRGHLPMCPPRASSPGSPEELRAATGGRGAGLQGRVWDSESGQQLSGHEPIPITGLGWHQGHHPPWMGPGQGPAGCRGQSPHRQLCAWLTHPACLSSPPGLLTCRVPTRPLGAGASRPAGTYRWGLCPASLRPRAGCHHSGPC